LKLRNRVYVINHKTVQKLLKECGLKCEIRIRKYRSYKGAIGKVALNILNRELILPNPNPKWVTYVTVFSLYDKRVYL